MNLPTTEPAVFFLTAFFVWSLPLSVFRSRFRKLAYQTNDWIINIKPYFWKELRVLFGKIPLDSKAKVQLRNQYRFYLVVYFMLIVGVINS
jgi:peroxiredoxin Q/BCP